jgi:hypothetical protein
MIYRYHACLPNSHLPPTPSSFLLLPASLGNLHEHDGALGNALEAISRFGNQRDCLFGREAPFVFFTRRPRHCDKDAGVGDSVQWAPTGAFNGACSIAATADVRRKRTCGVAAGGPRVGFSREAVKDGAAEPVAELAVAQGAVGLIVDVIWTREVYQVRFIDTAKWSSHATVPATTSTTSTTILAKTRTVDAGHGEEEGSENDGKLDHHGAGFCLREAFLFANDLALEIVRLEFQLLA